MDLTKDKLIDKAQEKFTVQSYEKAPTIDGVVIKDINCFTDEGGYFTELGRMSQGISEQFSGFEVKQINYSRLLPDGIKAYHLHLKQEDIWFVPPDERLLIILSDMRKDSPSEGVTMRFVMGEGKTRLVYIPRGVAHGVANLSKKDGTIIYFTNNQFDLTNPDEGRLPWDFLGKEIWEMTKG